MVCRAFLGKIAVVAPTHVKVAKVAVASLTDQAPLIEISTRTTNRSEPAAIKELASIPVSPGSRESIL